MDTDSFTVYIVYIHMIFTKKLQKMLKLDLKLQIKNQIDHCLKNRIKKVIGLINDELGGKIVIKLIGLRTKTYSYLIDDSSEDKKAKDTKKCFINEELKFENYRNC